MVASFLSILLNSIFLGFMFVDINILGYENFPTVLHLIPFQCGILVPRSELRIPLFELNALSSITLAVKDQKYIGVVQTRDANVIQNPETDDLNIADDDNENYTKITLKNSLIGGLYKCGCLGEILNIQEDEQGKMIVSIGGICRFDIVKELPIENSCRRALVSYDKYEMDIVQEADFSFDRKRLMHALRAYCKKLGIKPNWAELNSTSNEKLITMLMMICPFNTIEKQSLLETIGYTQQSNLITSLIEIDSVNRQSSSHLYH